VHVGTESGFDRLSTKAHLGFEVDNLAELRAAIGAAGLRVEDALPPVPGFDRFEFRDPFGNRMEFLQRLP
jgi:catechol 2,3-dioxygenase-like lactoylglutathione lyase family enzyme